MSFEAVRAWRDALQDLDPARIGGGLSSEGNTAVLSAALRAIDDDSLESVRRMTGEPFKTATLACASTVLTAPIEWCAVLLGRGTALTLKHHPGQDELIRHMVRIARMVGLPLSATDRRDQLAESELVVAMGTDETIDAIGTHLSKSTRFMGFGHRFSAAWVDKPDQFAWVAHDAALHDSRGCMSPCVVFTDLDINDALPVFADAMASAEGTLPRGRISLVEGATIRARRALAQVTGTVAVAKSWEVHAIPPTHFEPIALPRCVALVPVGGPADARAALAPYQRWLSTVGSSDLVQVADWGALRVCPLGSMQHPPLIRFHDGVDWLRLTLR